MAEALLRQSQIEIVEQITAENFVDLIGSQVDATARIYFSTKYHTGYITAVDTELADSTLCLFTKRGSGEPDCIFGFDVTRVTDDDYTTGGVPGCTSDSLSGSVFQVCAFYIYNKRVYDFLNGGAVLLRNHKYFQLSALSGSSAYVSPYEECGFHFVSIA